MSGLPPKANRRSWNGPGPLDQGWASFRGLWESSNAFLALLSAQGVLLRVSRRLAARLAYTVEELQGRAARDVVHLDDHGSLLALVEGRSGQGPVSLRWQAKDGAFCPIGWSSLGSLEGEVVLAVGLEPTDAPGQRAPDGWVATPFPPSIGGPYSLEADRCARCDFGRLFQLSHDLMATVDEEGRIVLANSAWGALLGHPPQELVGRTLLSLVHPSDREVATDCLGRIVAGQEATDVACRMLTPGGGNHLIRWSGSLDVASGMVRLVGRDRDEVRRVTEQVEHIDSIIDSVPHPILSLDETMLVRHVNRAASSVFGYEPPELLGKNIDEIVPGLSRASAAGGEPTSTSREPGTMTSERVGLRKDRTSFPVMVSLTAVSSALGRSVVVFAHDLTQDRLAQARALDEARALEASRVHVQLANELHDGLLQSLTGASLQLETIRTLWADDPAVALKRLDSLQSSLVDEQRELRLFVNEFTPGEDRGGGYEDPLLERLTRLLVRTEQTWDVQCRLSTRVEVEPDVTSAHDILRIVHEGIANAVRHGGASEIHVSVECLEDGARVHLRDDGRGFSFEGHRTQEELLAEGQGPLRILLRAGSRGGRVAIDSSTRGATVVVELPGESTTS